MNRLIIETKNFTSSVYDYLSKDEYHLFQQSLLRNPTLGAVMPGCGGLRKARFGEAKRQKGKRGGVRLINLDVPEASRIYMIDVYDKNEQEDLDSKTKKALKQPAQSIKDHFKKK